MSLDLAVMYALKNPIIKRGRNSISRFAAVLTDGTETFVGFNQYKTHPLMRKFSGRDEVICLHAEVDAIREFLNYLGQGYSVGKTMRYFTMYVARVLKDGTPALAKPCEACQRAIIHFGIKDCMWTI